MAASRVVYPPNSQPYDPHIRSTSPVMATSPPTRIRTSGVFTRRLSLTAASVANTVASSSLFGSSPPPSSSSSIYQQSSFFRSSSSTISHPAASSSSVNISSAANNITTSTSTSAAAVGDSSLGRPRSRSTSHPPPPKYKTYRTPQLRVSLQDAIGNLVLSPPVMAPGESIRGQINLELPKPTPVHSIEVCLIGTVTALDGTRLGSMKTVTILEECKTVATASITNTRTNTTRRHAQPAGVAVTSEEPNRGRGRRNSVSNNTVQERTRSPAIPIQNTIAAAVSATIAAQQGGNQRRFSTELMSRTNSMPSPYYSTGHSSSTLSLNRSISPTPVEMRGRRASFSANVDTPIVNGSFGALGRGSHNLSMVNISTMNQYSLDNGDEDLSSMPEAPSYDPPDYERIFSSTNERNSEENTSADVTTSSRSGSTTSDTTTSASSAITAGSDDTSATTVSSSPTNSVEDVSTSRQSRRSAREAQAQPAVEPEPKAVLMQSGNYVIPFSIRIPSNTVMSLPGSFSDPVGTISYQLKAVMRQILPNPDPYNPRALIVEPTFTSTPQVIKLIPMNDPTYMPLYNLPFETDSVRANVGHWVWSTGFMEARAWVPKQGYRPGRMVPLVIHIVNHSDAKQLVVETTLCKCLHYGSGLSKIRAMGIAGQGYLMDPFNAIESPDDGSSSINQTNETNNAERGHAGRRSSTINDGRNQDDSIPSPPASPYGANFPESTNSEQGDESPEGSIHGAHMASPNSMASISSQWESVHSNNSEGNSTPLTSGSMIYSTDCHNSVTSPPPNSVPAVVQQAPLPIVQHQREKITKSKTLINCNLAVDREIQKTILVPIPHTAGYSILNAPLLEVSYEIVVKIRAEKVYSRGIRLCVPIVVIIPEEGELEDEDDLMVSTGLASPESLARDLGLAFSGFEYDIGDQGSCPPYEASTGSGSRRRGRSRR
ncbi:Arrestin domain-containing protein 3 [Entomortierella beljakovae]|nr:Arrestin domain-containing protein 3 [Entomortierella beljakovae]